MQNQSSKPNAMQSIISKKVTETKMPPKTEVKGKVAITVQETRVRETDVAATPAQSVAQSARMGVALGSSKSKGKK